jgi:hypothetical protein
VYIQGLIKGLKEINSVDKIKFSKHNGKNYLKIEYMMMKSTLYYFDATAMKLLRK